MKPKVITLRLMIKFRDSAPLPLWAKKLASEEREKDIRVVGTVDSFWPQNVYHVLKKMSSVNAIRPSQDGTHLEKGDGNQMAPRISQNPQTLRPAKGAHNRRPTPSEVRAVNG
jgi:hypothetical protein